MLIGPGLLEGVQGQSGPFLRSVGNWFTWDAQRTAQGYAPMPSNYNVGDLLIAHVYALSMASFPPVDENGDAVTTWTLVGITRYSTGIYSRIADGTNDDLYLMGETSDTGQNGGAVQIAAIAGLGWSERAYQRDERNQQQRAPYTMESIPANIYTDTIVISQLKKVWNVQDQVPDGVNKPAFPGNLNVEGTNESDSATTMSDSAASWQDDAFVDKIITNVTDGSSGTVTASTATTVTVSALSGGTNNTWESTDSYSIAVPTIEKIGGTEFLLLEDLRTAVFLWGWRYDSVGIAFDDVELYQYPADDAFPNDGINEARSFRLTEDPT